MLAEVLSEARGQAGPGYLGAVSLSGVRNSVGAKEFANIEALKHLVDVRVCGKQQDQ